MDLLNIDPKTIWLIGILIFSIIIHEISHGYAALFQGDKTAEDAGRLTLNPIPHIDPLGSIILPAMLIISGSSFFLGWAKPVPYNPNNLKNKKWGESIVALAGPLSNLFLAIIFLLSAFFLSSIDMGTVTTFELLNMAILMNIFLAILNLIPIAPLDGSKILYALLPFNLAGKTRNFMEENYLIIFIFFIIFLYNTSFLEDIVFYFYSLLIKILS